METLGNEHRKFGTDWIYLGVILAAIAAVVWFLLPLRLEVSKSLLNTIRLLVIFGLFAAGYFYGHTKRPRFIVYDNGIKVIRQGEEMVYRWSEVTHFQGTRYTYSLYYVIPFVKYGANHFYNGGTKLFSVSVLTSRANTLVSFIQSKMAENRLPQLIEVLDNEAARLGFGKFWVSRNAIGNNKHQFPWEEVEQISFSREEFASVKVKSAKNRKPRKIGAAANQQKFELMGVIDHLSGTKHLPEEQAYLMDYKQQAKDVAVGLAKAAIVVIVICAALLAFAAAVRLPQGKPIFSPGCDCDVPTATPDEFQWLAAAPRELADVYPVPTNTPEP